MEIQSLLTGWDFLVIIVYILAVLALGFWVSFQKKYQEDLFLAGRQLGWPNIGFALFVTNIDPSMLIASASTAYATGMAAANFEWLAWPFLVLLSMVFIPHYLNTKISTMPEFMSRRFDQNCRVFLSIFTVISTLVLWLGCSLYAGGVLLGQILGWPLWTCLILLVAIAASFTVTGGLAAVAITNTFQSILMILASAVLTIIVVAKAGGVGTLIENVPADHWKLFLADDPEYPWYAMVGYGVMGVWFWCTDQTIVQRVLGARDLRQGQLGCVFLGFLKILIPFIFYIPGIACKILHPDLDTPDKAYITLVANYLPVGMVGLIVAVMIAALVSTVDSGLNSLSTVVTLDIYCKFFKPDATKKQIRRLGQIMTVIGAAAGISLALLLSNVKRMNLFNLLQSVIAFLAPPLPAVFLVGILWKRATSTAALATMIVGTAGCGILAYYKLSGRNEWIASQPFLLLSLYAFLCLVVFMVFVSLWTKPDNVAPLPRVRDSYGQLGHSAKPIWNWWKILALAMLIINIVFNWQAILAGWRWLKG